MEIRIGTSGWHYQHWRGAFYPTDLPAERMLEHYQRHFDTVEINNSFYRLPTLAAAQTWEKTTPAGFLFAVKASRFITHMKKLSDPASALLRFFPMVDELGGKCGPILFQLPPRWRVNVARLQAFLDALPRRHRYAFELREPSWLGEPVYGVLRAGGAALCIYHLDGFESPRELTTRFAYVRLHGPGGRYQGSYTRAALRAWADQLQEWQSALDAVYVYFDNDQHGYAVKDALALREMV